MDADILTQQIAEKYQNAKLNVAHSDIPKNADMVKSADTKQSACINIVMMRSIPLYI